MCSIVNYQIQPAVPPVIRPSISLLQRRRSISVSPDRETSPRPPLPPIRDIDEQSGEEEEERRDEDQPPPLKLAKRFFHILGIDVIIDADMNPQVLELNDRPSLGVTVDFEQDLKESVIAESFEHVCPNGDVRGDSPETSRWTKIYPTPPGSPWRDVVHRVLNPSHPTMEVQKQPPPTPQRSKLPLTQPGRKDKKKKKGKKKVSNKSSG
jgi:hypothetical protein